jgi:hypothetical protein
LTANLVQSRGYQTAQWSIVSFDLTLGVIGGFTGLIWEMLTYLLGGYESFKFNKSVIEEIYTTTDRSRMRQGHEPESMEQAQSDLRKALDTTRRYEYTYAEYLCTGWMQSCCCCCKRFAWYRNRDRRY